MNYSPSLRDQIRTDRIGSMTGKRHTINSPNAFAHAETFRAQYRRAPVANICATV